MVIKRGPATLRRGAERTRGMLTLEGRLLRFVPVERGAHGEAIEVVDIKRIDRRWNRVLGVIPVARTVMDVMMRNEQVFSFALAERKAWIAVLAEAQADTPKG